MTRAIRRLRRRAYVAVRVRLTAMAAAYGACGIAPVARAERARADVRADAYGMSTILPRTCPVSLCRWASAASVSG